MGFRGVKLSYRGAAPQPRYAAVHPQPFLRMGEEIELKQRGRVSRERTAAMPLEVIG